MLGLVAKIGEVIPEAAWQRCYVGLLKKSAFPPVIGACAGFDAMTAGILPQGSSTSLSGGLSINNFKNRANKAAASRFRFTAAAGEVGLDFHVTEAPPDRSGEAVPVLRLAMVAFRAPPVRR